MTHMLLSVLELVITILKRSDLLYLFDLPEITNGMKNSLEIKDPTSVEWFISVLCLPWFFLLNSVNDTLPGLGYSQPTEAPRNN